MEKTRKPNTRIHITTQNGVRLSGLYHLFQCDVKELKKLSNWINRIIEWKGGKNE